jgi:hypothetical protein
LRKRKKVHYSAVQTQGSSVRRENEGRVDPNLPFRQMVCRGMIWFELVRSIFRLTNPHMGLQQFFLVYKKYQAHESRDANKSGFWVGRTKIPTPKK